MTKRLFPFYGPEALEPVMTALYKDPANVFITRTAMLYIAKAPAQNYLVRARVTVI
jgi:hypothetical protein